MSNNFLNFASSKDRILISSDETFIESAKIDYWNDDD